MCAFNFAILQLQKSRKFDARKIYVFYSILIAVRVNRMWRNLPKSTQ